MKKRNKWYWGSLVGQRAQAIAFQADYKPTETTFGHLYTYVEGPFATRKEAVEDALYKGFQLVLSNPGVRWHEGKRREADQMDRSAKKPALKEFYHGKSVAHLESGLAARAMGMNPPKSIVAVADQIRKSGRSLVHWTRDINEARDHAFTLHQRGYKPKIESHPRHGWLVTIPLPKVNPYRPHGTFRSCVRWVSRQRPRVRDPKAICGAALSRKYATRKNPIAVYGFGNPRANGRINAKIEGVIYNRVVEIKAQKTGYKPGYYRHPFAAKSQVQILALDNGDLLVHSTAGVRLWQRD